MKHFLKTNWYKLMIGSSLFIFSVGFFIYSISSVYAGRTDSTSVKSEKTKATKDWDYVVGAGGNIYGGYWGITGLYWEIIGPNRYEN